VRAPTFIGWGAHDSAAPRRTATLLRAQLPVRAYHEFAHSGHVPMRTEPVEVVAAVRAFLEAPLGEVVAPRWPLDVGRDGICEGRRDRLFEGDYDRITLHRCKGAVLRNVRARELVIDGSEATLENVRLESLQVAATFRRSRVRWTGGTIRAEACVETDGAELDLAGVQCNFRTESIRVRQPSRFIASASVLDNGNETRLHGEYELFRTQKGALAELRPRSPGRAAQNSRAALKSELAGEYLVEEELGGASMRGADLSETQLSGARLEGADLREAQLAGARLVNAKLRGADLRGAKIGASDLRGADLRGADLRETSLDDANLEGAWFDDTTKFPRGFSPLSRKMRAGPTQSLVAP
jgi:uncharacterized protein YjbI with pentapeptide repeats